MSLQTVFADAVHADVALSPVAQTLHATQEVWPVTFWNVEPGVQDTAAPPTHALPIGHTAWPLRIV